MNSNIISFNNNSHEYSKFRPRYPKEIYEFLVDKCVDYENVWDCGCGNGQVAIDLINSFNNLYATDINQNQIDNAFKHDKIIYSIQNSESTNFEDSFFDLVCAAQCVHWFDFTKYFNELNRVMKNGSIFSCWGYSFFEVNPEIDLIIENELLKEIDSFWAVGNKLLHKGYDKIQFPFVQINTEKMIMQLDWNLHELSDYINTWSAVKLYDNNKQTKIVEKIKNRLNKIWNNEEKKRITMDLTWYVGRKL